MGACTSNQENPHMRVSAFSTEATPREKRYHRAIKLYEVDRVRSLTNLFNRNKQFSSGEIPLTLAALQGHEAVVEALLQKGADVNRIDGNGRAALHIAVQINDDETVDICLRNGADPNLRDSNTSTPLGVACEKGFSEIADKLLKAGANPDTCYRVAGSRYNGTLTNSQPALMRAVHLKYPECVQVLLDNGADPNYIDDKGNTPIQVAVSNGDANTTELLLKSPKFTGSCSSMNTSISKSLSLSTSPINASNSNSIHLVSLAALSGSRASLEALLRARCDLIGYSSEDVPPLIAATVRGSIDCVEVLLANGAEVDTVDKRGFTALQLAVYSAADTDRQGYYAKYFSNVYRTKARYDPTIINIDSAVRCAIILVQAGADVSKVWCRFAERFPYSPSDILPSKPTFLLAEVLIQSFGFLELSLSSVAREKFITRLIQCKAIGLLKLLYSAGVKPKWSDMASLALIPELSDFFKWTRHLTKEPRTLKDMCRRSIRHSLSNNVLYSVDNLPKLPEDLKDYIIIMDINHFSGMMMNKSMTEVV